jgi:hypothetical protein
MVWKWLGIRYDSLSSQALGKWWGDLLRIPFVYALKKQCQQAVAAAYVTQETLQKRYPPGGRFTTHYSSITLNPDLLAFGAKRFRERQYGEGKQQSSPPDICRQSLAALQRFACIVRGSPPMPNSGLGFGVGGSWGWILSQQNMRNWQNPCNCKMLSSTDILKGGQAIFEQLAEADLFVMPSLVEGLPRAMIEAMACGLPCIGTIIGGIPELLAKRILFLLETPRLWRVKSCRYSPIRPKCRKWANGIFTRSQEYHPDHLRERRNAFYQFVHDATMDRISGKS